MILTIMLWQKHRICYTQKNFIHHTSHSWKDLVEADTVTVKYYRAV